MKPGRAWYGTTAWSKAEWRNTFYPPGLPAGEQLAHYATQFDSVEADVTYYRVPDERLVRGWERVLPEAFRLAAKFPRSIVHGGAGPTPDPDKVLVHAAVKDDLERFLTHMAILGPKCGPLVLQFPHFDRKAFASAEPFLERLAAFLDRLPKTFRYGVEVRNAAWIGAELLDLLRARDVACVWVDLPYLPHPTDLGAKLDLFTADFAYARLIGDHRADDVRPASRNDVRGDPDARLARWAELVRASLESGRDVYAYASNHYSGYAPATIRELAARVAAN